MDDLASDCRPPAPCSEPDCDRAVAVLCYVPWDDDRPVCAPHGRSLGQRAGVVVEALPESEDDLLGLEE